MKIQTGTLIAAMLALGATSHAQVVEKKSLNLDGAKKAIVEAVDYAKKNNAPGGVIAVVDEGGNLMALERHQVAAFIDHSNHAARGVVFLRVINRCNDGFLCAVKIEGLFFHDLRMARGTESQHRRDQCSSLDFHKSFGVVAAGRSLVRRGQPVLDIYLTGCSKAASPRLVSAKAHHICTLAMSGTYSGTTIDFLTF